MISVLAILHVVVCVLLILLIMVQDPKGGSSGLFSGGSNSIISSSGSGDFLTTMTRYVGIAFGVLCVVLTIATKPSGSSVMSKLPVAVEQKTEAPAAGTEVAPEGAIAPKADAPAPATPAEQQ